MSGAMSEFSLKKMIWRKEIMSSWFQKPRGGKSKVPKTLFGTDLKPEIVDILVLLHRLKGEVEAFNFIEQYFFLVQVICSDTQYIDWAHEVSEHLARALAAAKFYNSFYMSSFLIYMLASLQLWPGLPRIEDFPEDVKSYEFYPCLQLQHSYADYVRVNDAFTMRICRELQGCPERRFSPEAMAAISQFGCYFIQFSSFSYLRLAAFDGFPMKLPRYPDDMIVLVEIVRQAVQVNVLSASMRKKGYEFPIRVGAYSCEARPDAKNILKAFESRYKLQEYEVVRPMFDPNGYARDVLQIGSVIKHVTTMEDYWADCKNELESRDRAFARFTVDQVKMYGVNLDVEGIEDDGQNMYSNTYLTKLRNTPVSSEPYFDIEEDFNVMMARIIKRTGKWVEWTAKKGRSRSKATQASPAAATPASSQSATPSATTSTAQGPAQSAGGGDQPPEKNIPIAPTCQGGSLPVIGTQAAAEEKGTEEPKDGSTSPTPPSHSTPPPSPQLAPSSPSHHSPTPSAGAPFLKPTGSPIQIVEIRDDQSSSTEPEEEEVPSSSRLLSRDPKNPFSVAAATVTQVKKKMFTIESLGTASKIISTESWLEDTLEKKRKRKDDSTPAKDIVSQAVRSGTAMVKAKKQRTLSILGHDTETGHLTMEVAKPNRLGRIEDLTPADFTLHSIDLGEARHDTKVGLWRSSNEVIEEQLENLKVSKIKMKAEIEELRRFIRQLVVPLATITGLPATEEPSAEEVQAFISQLQRDRHFGQIGREWIEKLNADGIALIDQIGNVLIRLEAEKGNITTNSNILAGEEAKCTDTISLLKMIIQMKIKEAIEAKILKKGDEPLNEWIRSMQFKKEMIQEAEKGLRETGDKVKKAQEKAFELMRGLHTESQTSGQGKSFIDIEVMKNNFTTYLSSLSGMVSSSQNRVSELQTLGGCVYVAAEEVANQQNQAKELTQEHARWLLRFTNVYVPNHNDLTPIIAAAKAYKAKTEKGKKPK